MTLDEQLQGISEKLGQLNVNDRGDLAEISRLTTMQNELLAQQALEQRVQVQEEKVSSIVLPYNFSEVFDDERANDIITEVIKDFQRQAYAEHNQELTEMATAHREELRLVASDRDQAKIRMQLLSDNLGEEKQAHDEVLQLLNETKLRLNDAESKRDAAVAKAEGLELLLSEKQSQIDTLREEIAIGARAAVNVTRIETTDRLASLVEASKQAKVKSALDIALENATPFRGKVQSGVQLDALEVQPFPRIDQADGTGFQLVAGSIDIIPTENQVEAFRPEEVRGEHTMDSGNADTVGESEKTLEQRVAALEAHVFGS